MSENKIDEEYIKEYKKLHDDFIHGRGNFSSGEDYSGFREKKKKSPKTKRCRCKK